MAQEQTEASKKELEQSLAQNPLNNLVQKLEKDLDLNQNFFLGGNVDHEQALIKNQKIVPKKTIKKRKSGKSTVQQKINCKIF